MARKVLLPEAVALFPGKVHLPPPLKWAGGKRWLVPLLATLYSPYNGLRLVEPFVGGMAVALGILPDKALLGDINQHLINFYKQLQKGLVIDTEMRNEERHYYKARERFNELIRKQKAGSKEAAELFYYLNRTGFNGLCRFNKKGEFNVPFGRYKNINYRRDFSEYAAVLSRYDIIVSDFRSFPFEESDFVYADPPYDVEFTSYSAGGFSFEDQTDLAVRLSRHPGPVLISNQSTKRIIELYGDLGFALHYLSAPRRISCNGDRTPAQEVLAVKGFDRRIIEKARLLSR